VLFELCYFVLCCGGKGLLFPLFKNVLFLSNKNVFFMYLKILKAPFELSNCIVVLSFA